MQEAEPKKANSRSRKGKKTRKNIKSRRQNTGPARTGQFGNQVGRPTDYKPEYCQMLIDHYKKGFDFESFAAVVGCTPRTLYDWCTKQPDFLQAREEGLQHHKMLMLDVGARAAAGQLRVVLKETPVLDVEGRPVYDAKGQMVVEREYAKTTAAQKIWTLMMKNIHGWKERLELEGGENPIKITSEARSKLLANKDAREAARKYAEAMLSAINESESS